MFDPLKNDDDNDNGELVTSGMSIDMTNTFKIRERLKQGGGLNPTLSRVYDEIIKKRNERTNR